MNGFRENHLEQREVRITGIEQAGEFPLRLDQRHRPTLPPHRRLLGLGRVNEFLKFLGELAVTLPGLVGGKLHHGGEEAVLVAGDMALQQGDDVAGGGHKLFFSGFPVRPRGDALDVNFSTAICIAESCLFPCAVMAASQVPNLKIVPQLVPPCPLPPQARVLRAPDHARKSRAIGDAGQVMPIRHGAMPYSGLSSGRSRVWPPFQNA